MNNLKKAKQIINVKTSPLGKNISLYHDRQRILQDALLTNIDQKGSKSPKPTKKPSLNKYANSQVEQLLYNYANLIKRVSQHAQVAKLSIKNQIRKHQIYYNEMVQIIKSHQEKTYSQLIEQLKKVQQLFNLKTAALKMKIHQLGSVSAPIHIQKELNQLQVQKILKVDMIKVQGMSIRFLKEQINKLCFRLSKSLPSSPQKESSVNELICDQEIEWSRKSMFQNKHKHEYSAPQIISQSPELNQDSIFSIE